MTWGGVGGIPPEPSAAACSGFPPEFGVLRRLAEIVGQGGLSSHTCQTSEVVPAKQMRTSTPAKERRIQRYYAPALVHVVHGTRSHMVKDSPVLFILLAAG